MRLTLWSFMSLTTSESSASSATQTTSRVMTSRTLRPCVWTYSDDNRPGPSRISSHFGRLRSVPSSMRRSRSPSERTPTSAPAASSTISPLMRFSSISAAACVIEASGEMATRPGLITSLRA